MQISRNLKRQAFSQRNRATKRAVGVEVGGDGAEGLKKIQNKGEGRQYSGGLHKIGGVRKPLPTTLMQVRLYQ